MRQTGFASLASGSKANAHFIRTPQTAVLIDCGLSLKHLQERLQMIGADIEEIQAILVTHDHSDHIKGLQQVSDKLQVPILANRETAKAIMKTFESHFPMKLFVTEESFLFKDLHVFPMSVQHDTLDPVAFIVEFNHAKLGIVTDLGLLTSSVKHHVQALDYLVVEANHDVELVHSCSRPEVYKRRVLSKQGHLSNMSAVDLIEAADIGALKQVFLAHLSSECNQPDLAIKAVKDRINNPGFQLGIAPQDQPTPFIEVG